MAETPRPGFLGRTGGVGTSTSRLVVIRGNSGSGKTTVARLVRDRRPKNTVALVGQDNLRRTILGVRDHAGNPAIGLIDLTARHALEHGLDVVVEGIMYAENYAPMLRDLVRDHRGITSCYLYDLSFDETLRRHATKADVTFGETEMRTWWHSRQPVMGLNETSIFEPETIEETTSRILRVWT